MIPVPEHLADAVRRAAAAAPGHAGDIAGLRQRIRSRSRRRRAVAAGCAAALAGVSATAIPLLTGGPGIEAAPPAAPLVTTAMAPTRAPEPAQRLLLWGGGATWQAPGGPDIGLLGGPADEVLADGSVRRHRITGVDSAEQVVALPDGRLVIRGSTDLMPGVPRTEDGPWVKGLSIRLLVLRPDDTIEIAREIRKVGESVTLVGATAQVAYLLRADRLVAHDLATGRERVALRGIPLDGAQIDVAGGRLAIGDDGRIGRCDVRVLELATGAEQTRLSVDGACGRIRLSPDASLLGISYGTATDPNAARVAILDVAAGAVRGERLLATNRPGSERRMRGTWGMAWSDAATVRVVWAELPPDANRVYRVDEVMKVVEVTVQ